MRRDIGMLLIGGAIELTGCAQTRELPAILPHPEPESIAVERFRHALPQPAASELRVYTIELEPGGITPAHHHPGALVAYVLEGAVLSRTDSGAAVRYEEGQLWFEPSTTTRSETRNASITQPARVLVVYLTDPGKPLREAETK